MEQADKIQKLQKALGEALLALDEAECMAAGLSWPQKGAWDEVLKQETRLLSVDTFDTIAYIRGLLAIVLESHGLPRPAAKEYIKPDPGVIEIE
jgi:hypothetical protein